ncbi:MAG: GGDEF domain-containing protein [Gemmatimonadetes bacterium]|nr:GGDEF domain-containing protein [Gemmatimonadota bacterium]
MNIVDVSLWERLLEAVVELGALPGAETRSETLARPVLQACHHIPGVSEARLVLVEEDHLRCYVLGAEGSFRSVRRPRAHGRELTEVRAPWLSTSPHGVALAWLLEETTQDAVLAPFRVEADGRAGALILTGASLDSEAARILGLLARHTARLLDHTLVLRQLEHEARTDGLTGAINYRHFMECLQTEVKRASRFGLFFTVLMVDADNLKQYNDRFGHLSGSHALKEMAEIFLRSAREIDVVAKYGGDEFSLLLPHTSMSGALVFAQRIHQSVREHAFEGDPNRRLTMSVGIARFPEDGDDPRELLKCADQRLYRAKSTGRDRICTTTEDTDRTPVEENQHP